jgi:acetolactate decarboxylase
MLLLCAIGCARMNANRDVVYMTSTIHALVEALFDGEVTFGELKRHGNLGLGAVDAVAGELILLDGTCYSARSDGSVVVLSDSQKSPYALATWFDADRVVDIREEIDFEQLKKRLDAEFGNFNLPYAFRIEGTFSYIRARSVPPANKPYPRLIDAIKTQRQFEFHDVSGVIVGFRLPAHLDSVGVPGYHFHFLSADRKGGGHLMAFRSSRLRVAGDLSPEIHLVLPQSEAFSKVDLTHRDPNEINQIMGRTGPK